MNKFILTLNVTCFFNPDSEQPTNIVCASPGSCLQCTISWVNEKGVYSTDWLVVFARKEPVIDQVKASELNEFDQHQITIGSYSGSRDDPVHLKYIFPVNLSLSLACVYRAVINAVKKPCPYTKSAKKPLCVRLALLFS